LRAVLDQQSRRFVRPPIKEGASGHVCKSGDQEFARILPYPPPAESFGAKTNHLPNIQGLTDHPALQEGVRVKKFGRNRSVRPPSKIEISLIPSMTANRGFIGPIQGVNSPCESTRHLGRESRIRAGIVKIGAYSAAAANEHFALAADIMKSEIRGTISDLNREPLKTP